MKKSAGILSLFIFLFLGNLVKGQISGPETINFSTTDNTNLGSTANDGEGGSTDITGVQINIVAIDASGNATGADLIYNVTDFGFGATGEEGISVSNDPATTAWRGIKITSADGSEFDFNGFESWEFAGAGAVTLNVRGFKNGVATGSGPVALTTAELDRKEHSATDFPDADFGDVDEVRIIAATDYFGTFDVFLFGAVAVSNAAPTLTSFTSSVETTNEDAAVEITFAEMAAQGDEADSDGTVDAFVVQAVSSGTLMINGGPYLAGVNEEITAAASASWTPDADANGTLNAFTVKAKDNSNALSTTAIQTTVSVTAVNDEPSFTKGANETVLEDAGAQTVSNWATSLSKGPADETGQTLSFAVTNNNNALFSAQPAIDASGNLTYTPAADANGAATVDVVLSDDGGTANGGDDTFTTQQFTVTVTAVNDEPSFTKGADQEVNKNSGAQTVNNWATNLNSGAANEASQTLSFALTNNNNSLFSAQPAIDASGNLTFTPAADATGNATVTVVLSDDGGTANGGDNEFAAQQFTITVVDPATAPSVTTNAASSIVADGATLNGNVTSDGGAAITERGFVYAKTSDDGTPTVAEANGSTVVKVVVSGTTGSFNENLASLTSNTGYNYIAYAINSAGTTEGSVQTFTSASPTIAFNSTSSNGTESINSANLLIDLSVASTSAVTVDYTVTGTATGNGTDYTLANGTLTIAAGNTTDNITIASIVEDALDEVDETVIVTLSNPTNATLGTNTVHTYTIIDNDGAPAVSFALTTDGQSESESGQDIQVSLSAISGKTVTVDYTVGGTATGGGTDHNTTSGTLTFNPGDQDITLAIVGIVDDALDEDDETIILTLSNPSNASLGTNKVHTYTITDNDPLPNISFTNTGSNGLESNTSADLGLSLSAVSGRDITVDYTVSGTATGGGTDFTLANGTLTITAGNTTKNIVISIEDDTMVEGDETVVLTLSNPSNASLGTNTVHTYTINDNDNTPPAFTSTAITTVNAGEQYSYNITTNDADGDGVTVTATTKPTWLALNSENILSGTAPGETGDHSVVLKADDGKGGIVEQSFTIKVLTIPTVIASEATSIFPNGVTLNGNVTGDGGATITERGFVYAKTSDDASPTVAEANGTTIIKVNVDGNTGVFEKAITGLSRDIEYSFVAYAINSVGISISEVKTFVPTNNAPTFTSEAVLTIDEGNAYSYAITTNDVDGHSVTVTATKIPDWLTLSAENVLSGSTTGQVGNHDVVLKADDGNGGMSEQSFTIAVKGKPVIETKDILSVSGSGARLFGSITSDGGEAVETGGFVYAKTTDDADPTLAEVNGTTVFNVNVDIKDEANSFFTDISGLSGRTAYSYIAYGTNRLGTTESSVVKAFSTPNNPPSISSPPVVSVNEGDEYTYVIATSDPDGDVVSVKATTIPEWLTLTAEPVEVVVNTLAGGPNLRGHVDGAGPVARFNTPFSIALDATGNIFVADWANNVIRKVTPSGEVSTFAGSGAGVSVDGQGREAGINRPMGIAVDKTTGNIYVSEGDFRQPKIRKITPEGVVTTLAGSGRGEEVDGTGIQASFKDVRGLEVGPSGNIFVTGGTHIRKITPEGVVTTIESSAPIGQLHDVAIDEMGNMYASERFGAKIHKITPEGVVTTLAGSGEQGTMDGTGTDATFESPIGIALDASGNLIVTDQDGHNIRMITPEGVVTTLAGSLSGVPNSDILDGVGNNASFLSPVGLDIDNEGKIYVVGRDSNQIRIIAVSYIYTLKGSSEDKAGTYDIVLLAKDTHAATSEQAFTVSVVEKPTVISSGATSVITRGATLNGEITQNGYGTITERGFVYAKTSDDSSPTFTEVNGTTVFKIGATGTEATFNTVIGGLSPNVEYSFIAYAVNSAGAGESAVQTFTTFNNVPEFDSEATTIVDEGDIYTYSFTVTDLDGDDVAVTGTTLPDWLTLSSVTETVVSTFAGAGGFIGGDVDGVGTAAQFSSPSDVATDAAGNVYVVDKFNHKIRKITPGAEVTTLAGSGNLGDADGVGLAASFNRPDGIAIDGTGNLYVAEERSDRIRKITPLGVVSTFASFDSPRWLATDVMGNIYVGGTTISKITPSGEVTTLAASSAGGIAIDASGNIFAAATNQINKITPEGVVSTLAGTATAGYADGTGTAARFDGIGALALDAAGSVYVVDYNNSRIRKITPEGIVTTLAGSGEFGSTDGIESEASFAGPTGLAIDSRGNLFVADFNNHKIRKIVSTTTYTLSGNSNGKAGDHEVSLKLDDGNGGINEQSFTVSVNLPPTDISLDVSSIDENNSVNQKVGDLSTTDEAETNAHIYTLVSGTGDTDNAKFSIDGVGLLASESFNHEANESFSVRIQTDDGKGGTFQKAFTITVNDVNEAPIALALSNNVIDESDDADVLVGTMSTMDPDDGETFTYSLVTGEGDANNLLFKFGGSELRTSDAIDFEETSTLSIRVQVTDNEGLTFEKAFTITVNDVTIEPLRDFEGGQADSRVKNVFTPNRDGVNDTWVIEDILDNPINEVKVFNQAGKLVFSQRNYENDWDGTFDGEPIPAGTYYYEINIYNGESIIRGFLTILRN